MAAIAREAAAPEIAPALASVPDIQALDKQALARLVAEGARELAER
jgi:hypothetical protein